MGTPAFKHKLGGIFYNQDTNGEIFIKKELHLKWAIRLRTEGAKMGSDARRQADSGPDVVGADACVAPTIIMSTESVQPPK